MKSKVVKIIEQSGWFDSEYYLSQYPDVSASTLSPLEHYLSVGVGLGYNPCSRFNTLFYVQEYKDVADAGVNPLRHFIETGNAEGRFPNSAEKEISLIAKSGYFDTKFYLANNASTIEESGMTPVEHFYYVGGREGCNPNLSFDCLFYLEEYKDVSTSGINPLLHYIQFGEREKRFISSIDKENRLVKESGLFDENFYSRFFPELQKEKIDPVSHYLEIGYKDGVCPSAQFDSAWYLSAYPDVCTIGVNPLLHYLRRGRKEGRFKNAVEKDNFLLVKKSALFDESLYISDNTEIFAEYAGPIQHYNDVGYKHQLRPNGVFDPVWYHRFYSLSENLNPLIHYIHHRDMFPIYQNQMAHDLVNRIEEADDLFFCEACQSPNLFPPAIREQAVQFLSGKDVRVSVVVPVWNRERTIEVALDSAMAQSIPPCEILVYDDGSTDASVETVMKKFKEKGGEIASSVEIVCSKENRGVSHARNQLLKKAKGTFIAYLDSDNTWHPDHLLYTLFALYFNKSDSAYSGVKINDHDSGGQRYLYRKFSRKGLLRQNFIDLNSYIHRRSLFEKWGGFDEKLRRLVDWDFIIRLTKEDAIASVSATTVNYNIGRNAFGNISCREALEENIELIELKNMVELQQLNLISKAKWDYLISKKSKQAVLYNEAGTTSDSRSCSDSALMDAQQRLAAVQKENLFLLLQLAAIQREFEYSLGNQMGLGMEKENV